MCKELTCQQNECSGLWQADLGKPDATAAAEPKVAEEPEVTEELPDPESRMGTSQILPAGPRVDESEMRGAEPETNPESTFTDFYDPVTIDLSDDDDDPPAKRARN